MVGRIAFIGFGEAGRAFSAGLTRPVHAYDRQTDSEDTRSAMLAAYRGSGVTGHMTLAAALEGAALILSLVTADNAIEAARAAAAAITRDALYCDMNSVAPDTKRAAAALIERAGGRYVDVAITAPVHPAGRAAPLLTSGTAAAAVADALRGIGFGNVRALDGGVGRASAIKVIRSVMIKGIEALTTECALAAHAAGVFDEVFASLDASWPGADWRARADYNLERMMVHGTRRAAEMEEVVKTLKALGTGADMTRGTVVRQRALGMLGLRPAATLGEKLGQLRIPTPEHAA